MVSTGGTNVNFPTQEHTPEENSSPIITQQSFSHCQIFLTRLDVTAGKLDNKLASQAQGVLDTSLNRFRDSSC